MSWLEVNRLSIGFSLPEGRVEAVRELSFSMGQGEAIGLLGPSGSGKSLTARAILGLLPRAARLGGESRLTFEEKTDLRKLSEKQWQAIRGKRIAYLFQDPSSTLNPVFTCGNQLVETMRHFSPHLSRKEARALAEESLAEMEIRDPRRILKSYPHQISGGQKQRMMLALSLAGDPDLLIADEPTTSLDATVQKSILDLLLRQRKKRGLSLIFISHDLDAVRYMTDRILVLENGVLVEDLAVDHLEEKARSDYLCRILQEAPPRREAVQGPSAGRPLLRVEGLHCRYGLTGRWFGKKETVHALQGVSFQMQSGERLGVVGESGSGKSTLARAILGLVSPEKGSISLLSDLPEGRRAQAVQLIYQFPQASLNPTLTIGAAIGEPLRTARFGLRGKERKEAVLSLMQRVGLETDLYTRYPRELSGGQQQRVALARALSVKPRLLICDEAVSSLDLPVQLQVIRLLLELNQQEGIGLLFISHNLKTIQQIAERVLVMDAGKIVEDAGVEELFRQPISDMARRLLEARL